MRQLISIILLFFVFTHWAAAQGIEGRKKLERKSSTTYPSPTYSPPKTTPTAQPDATGQPGKTGDGTEKANPGQPGNNTNPQAPGYKPDPRLLMGMVLDSETGKPVADALIKVRKTDYAVFTNTYGVYNIQLADRDLPVEVEVRVQGYKKLRTRITEPGKEYKLQLERK
ncbi:MAG: hypothetical protein ACK51A_03190 [Sphingobacteriia bacterium]